MSFKEQVKVNISVAQWIDYEHSLFFLGPSSKTPETRK